MVTAPIAFAVFHAECRKDLILYHYDLGQGVLLEDSVLQHTRCCPGIHCLVAVQHHDLQTRAVLVPHLVCMYLGGGCPSKYLTAESARA
jgi:hypothetical protein